MKVEKKKNVGDVFRRGSGILAVIVFSVGTSVLAGWCLDVPLLKSVFPNIVSMKANTALCFVLLGASLWGLQGKRGDVVPWRWGACLLAGAVLVIGALTFCEYAFGWDLGIDQALFQEPSVQVMTLSPGRMALNTSVCFSFLGSAILLSCARSASAVIVSQVLCLASGGIALVSLLSYLYGVSTFLFGIARFMTMAIHTTVTFVLISLGVIFRKPGIGIMEVVADEHEAGVVTRRFLAIIAILAVATDLLVSAGVRFHLYDMTLATVLHAAALFMAFGGVVVASGFAMKGEEEGRMLGERKYRALYEFSSDAIMMVVPGRGFVAANPAGLAIFGFQDEAEMMAKTPAELSPEYQPDGEDSSEKAQRMMAIAQEKGTHIFEWRHRRLDGEEFWATVLLSRVIIGEKAMLQATVRDVTAQKEQEIELQKKVGELEKFHQVTIDREKRVIELKEEITKLKERLEGYERPS